MIITRTQAEFNELATRATALFVKVHAARGDGTKSFPMGEKHTQSSGDDIAAFQRHQAAGRLKLAAMYLSMALVEMHPPHRNEMKAAFRTANIPFDLDEWENWLQGVPIEECHMWYFFDEWKESINA